MMCGSCVFVFIVLLIGVLSFGWWVLLGLAPQTYQTLAYKHIHDNNVHMLLDNMWCSDAPQLGGPMKPIVWEIAFMC